MKTGTKQAKRGTNHGRVHTSYTSPTGTLLFISPISTPVPPDEPHTPLLLGELTSVELVEALCLRRQGLLKACFNVPARLSVPLVSWPQSSPVSPSYTPCSMVLPRRLMVKLTSRSLRMWTLPKALKSVLASNVVPTHHEIKSITINRMAATGIRVHSPLLNSSASRPKALANATVLWINGLRPTIHATMTGLSTLTTRAVAHMANCTGLREFRTRGRCDDDSGGNCPVTGAPVAVSREIGMRSDNKAHNFVRSVLRFSPVLP